MSETWTDDRVNLLKQHWAAGLSCTEISREFDGKISRNAVIGKIHRLGLEGRILIREPKPPKAKPPRKRIPKPKQTTIFQIDRTNGLRCVEIDPLHLTILDLEEHHCRYPFGEAPITFCGHRKVDGSSYCLDHHHLTTREWIEKEKAA